MAKTKTSYFCQQCGVESPKWTGKCSSCGAWNTMVEEVVQRAEKVRPETMPWDEENGNGSRKAQRLEDVEITNEVRMASPDSELNRVLGGGLVPGSVVLVAGDPGIGKSTLFLQCALQWKNITTLYVSGE